MMNQSTIVGRLVRTPEITQLENGTKVTNITIAVNRTFKNKDGEYETDFIDCTLWNSVAENTATYCKKGDIISVRGRLQTDYELVGDQNRKKMTLVAERITFISASKEKDTSITDDMEIN